MPLETGSSRAAISHNISVERHAGRPEAQAVAIALSKARSDAADARIQAAGLLHLCRRLTATDTALFVRRAPGGDHAGEWCFPGGKLEPGETAEQAAERETMEECGPTPHSMPIPWTRSTGSDVEYTTFLAHVPHEFAVTLNDENTAWCWAPPDTPPLPIHPGCVEALGKLTSAQPAAVAALAAKIDAAVAASAALAGIWQK